MTIATDPLTSKGEKILSNMTAQYGSPEKAKQVLYSSKNAGTITGIDQTGLGFLGSLRGFLRDLLAWAKEEEDEPEHTATEEDTGLSNTAVTAPDEADAEPPLKPILNSEVRSANDMALDRNSVRSKDADGRLHVDQANISKANICPYKGSEIPDYERLGLDPDKIYQLLRHPDELAKAVSSFNRLPILSEHRPASADEHPKELVIGATGDNAAFEPPYLKNSLVFWPQDAIDDIESGEKRELSSAYRYDADMTPGVYDGVPYDGVMRNIVGNHVAAVREGRAGRDVVVGDSKLQEVNDMTTVKTEDWQKLRSLVAAVKPKLAQDQIEMKDIKPLLEHAENLVNGNGNGEELPPPPPEDQMTTAPSSSVPLTDNWEGMDEEEDEEEQKAADRLYRARAADARRRLGRDETDEEKDKRESEDSAADAREKLGRDETDKECADRQARDARTRARRAADKRAIIPSAKDQVVTKKAMDAAMAAVQASVMRTQREIRAAEREVRPYVGELAMDHDSAAAVRRTALTMLGVKTEGVHPSAYSTILAMQPLPGARKAPTVALDSAAAKGFAERFPEALRINVI